MGEPIAIVGLACRYPGARSPDELWENVLSQRRAFRRIPAERLRAADYAAAEPGDPDRTYLTHAAVLEDWEFDRVRFRVAGSTFRSTDLTHWLALQVAAEALTDAGWPGGDGLDRARTGVLVGNTLTGEFSRAQILRLRWPYVRRVFSAALAGEGWSEEARGRFLERTEATFKAPFQAMDEDGLAGGLSNTIAGRIANTFDFGGGGYTVDGACAASLLAISNACSALAAGDLDVVVAGGVDLSLDPFELVGFAQAGAFAHEQMRVFDQRSDGFWPGEGCGFVVLERLADTLAGGRRASAVIRGWGISSDGTGSIIRPRVGGQLLALRRAYQRAGFGIAAVDLFEGHGTGTSVGDQAELTALTTTRREDGARSAAAIGSVKANIGHTKAAAGVAGVVKAVLSLRERVIPPTTACDLPHELLQRADAVLRAVPAAEPWPHAARGRAAVSAMGFGGINAHVVLEGAAGPLRLPRAARRLSRSAQDAELFVFAAQDGRRLRERIDVVGAQARGLSFAELADLTATLYGELPRSRRGARAAAVASTAEELATALEHLSAWLAEDADGARVDVQRGIALGFGAPTLRVGLLFPGQGSPTPDDAGALGRRFALGHASCDAAGGGRGSTAVAQPAIVAASLTGLALCKRLGLHATVAVGHSLGELTALHWAGAIDAVDVAALAASRGRAMAGCATPEGAMASIATSAGLVEALLADVPSVVIAGYNSPRQTVVSGPARAVDTVVERARAAGNAAVRLPVSHAFHSPLMKAAAVRLATVLDATPLALPEHPVVSTVTGAPLEEGVDLRQLLVAQVTEPVLFQQAVGTALERADALLEVGPGRVLQGLARQNAAVPVLALDVGGPSLQPALTAAGTLWALGATLRLGPLFSGRFTRTLALDRPRRFLANPCELAALDEGTSNGLPPVAANIPGYDRALGPDPAAPRNALDALRAILARRTELPEDAITPNSHLLGDLHLTSIAVSEIAAGAVRELGGAPLPPTTEFANATVGELAAAIELADADTAGAAETEMPDGVEAWFRPFAVQLAERPDSDGTALPCRWTVMIAPGHPLEQAIRAAFAGDDGEPALLVCLAPDLDDAQAQLLLRAAQQVLTGGVRRCAVLQHGGGGAGFAKTLHLEAGRLDTTVVDLPADPALLASARRQAESTRGFRELVCDAAGGWRGAVLCPLPLAGSTSSALGAGDVLLISGGGKGIGAECALALAEASGAAIALLGRSRPEDDPALEANLRRIEAHGVRHLYIAADVRNRASVQHAVARVRAELGEVTGVLHAAGVNVPARIPDLGNDAMVATLAPKLAGLRNLVGAVDADSLRLLVTFGSIIARTGLRGEAHYALANDWMGLEVSRLRRRLRACRCLNVEWSAWTGAGMAERLGTVAALAQQGVSPIPLDRGVELLTELLAADGLPATVVVAGRFGAPPTIDFDAPELPVHRFLERVRVHYPSTELVVEADISRGTDPYLDDHVIDGVALLPVVFALEAIASVAATIAVGDSGVELRDIRALRPVTVPADGSRTVRLAGLARRDGSVDVVLRSDETGFQADHVRATYRADAEPLGDWDGAAPCATTINLDPGRHLYGSLLFQGPRFRRISQYRRLTARSCVAQIRTGVQTLWFGAFLPQGLALGDPGARDAVIHAIQPCIPHERVVPVGIDRLRLRPAVDGPVTVHARERSGDGASFLYDVVVVDAAGRVVERWDGLALHRIGPAATRTSWPCALLAPYLERRAAQLVDGATLAVAVVFDDDGARTSDAAIAAAAGRPADVHRRPDGRPEIRGGAPAVSAAHLDGYTIAVAGQGPLACDVEAVAGRSVHGWSLLLAEERLALARLLSADVGEGFDTAATRIWASLECVKKAGFPIRSPMKLATSSDDGWTLLRSGDLAVATFATRIDGLDRPVVIALLSTAAVAGEVIDARHDDLRRLAARRAASNVREAPTA